jgi:hypothetical protein
LAGLEGLDAGDGEQALTIAEESASTL